MTEKHFTFYSPHDRSADVVTSTTTSTVAPPFAVRLADIATTSTVPSAAVTKPSLCGRFQFECQTSKECIAVSVRDDAKLLSGLFHLSLAILQIYNVCDQINQCEDGSDEGPECATAASGNRKDARYPGSGGVVSAEAERGNQF